MALFSIVAQQYINNCCKPAPFPIPLPSIPCCVRSGDDNITVHREGIFGRCTVDLADNLSVNGIENSVQLSSAHIPDGAIDVTAEVPSHLVAGARLDQNGKIYRVFNVVGSATAGDAMSYLTPLPPVPANTLVIGVTATVQSVTADLHPGTIVLSNLVEIVSAFGISAANLPANRFKEATLFVDNTVLGLSYRITGNLVYDAANTTLTITVDNGYTPNITNILPGTEVAVIVGTGTNFAQLVDPLNPIIDAPAGVLMRSVVADASGVPIKRWLQTQGPVTVNALPGLAIGTVVRLSATPGQVEAIFAGTTNPMGVVLNTGGAAAVANINLILE